MYALAIIDFLDQYQEVSRDINQTLNNVVTEAKLDNIHRISFPKHGDFNYVDPKGIRFDNFLDYARKNNFTFKISTYNDMRVIIFSTFYLSIIEQNRKTIDFIMLPNVWDEIKDKISN